MFVFLFKVVCLIQTCLYFCVRKETQMTSENTNKKTTCNKKSAAAVIPVPAQVIADIVGVSESYVKKIRENTRRTNTETAVKVKYCDELIIEGQQVLIKEVSKIIHKPSKKSDQQ